MLFPYVRQERHKTRSLDRLRQLTLVLRADARVPRIDDLRLARNKAAEKVHLFIIDVV